MRDDYRAGVNKIPVSKCWKVHIFVRIWTLPYSSSLGELFTLRDYRVTLIKVHNQQKINVIFIFTLRFVSDT